MSYQVRAPKVGDLRAIYRGNDEISEKEFIFLMAERCITLNGKPITTEQLDEMDLTEFNKLTEVLNASVDLEKKS